MTSVESRRPEHVFYETAYWALAVLGVIGVTIGFFVSPGLCIFFASCLVILCYARFVEPVWIKVTLYRQALVAEPQAWIKLVYLSDLHAGLRKSAQYYERVAERVNQQGPDIVFIGGDLVEREERALQDLKALQSISSTQGNYFVLGNHDFLDQPERIRESLQAWGYEDITNQQRILSVKNGTFELMGLDDTWFGQPMKLVSSAPHLPRVIVAHEPDVLLDMEAGDAELVLLGHTHGGQVRLPWYGAVKRLPQFAPQWLDRGYKLWKKIPVIISQGLGEADAPVRLCCRPEIVVVEIGV